jgi:hypothetical protein
MTYRRKCNRRNLHAQCGFCLEGPVEELVAGIGGAWAWDGVEGGARCCVRVNGNTVIPWPGGFRSVS